MCCASSSQANPRKHAHMLVLRSNRRTAASQPPPLFCRRCALRGLQQQVVARVVRSHRPLVHSVEYGCPRCQDICSGVITHIRAEQFLQQLQPATCSSLIPNACECDQRCVFRCAHTSITAWSSRCQWRWSARSQQCCHGCTAVAYWQSLVAPSLVGPFVWRGYAGIGWSRGDA